MKHDTVEGFLESMTISIPREAGGRVGTLLWAHGVLFRHAPFSSTDSSVREYIQGHLPIDNVEFASMPTFQGEIHYNQFTIAVMNVTNNLVLNRLSKWISENLLEEKNYLAHAKKLDSKKRTK